MHEFPFNYTKSIQAAAALLRLSPSQEMSQLRLLKLLYIATRESFQEKGYPLVADRYASLDNGPILSRLYNIIKGEDVYSVNWSQHIARDGYMLQLQRDPGNDLLSRYEMRKLQEISTRMRDRDDFDIVNETHTFAEWRDPQGSSIPIDMRDLLRAVGREEIADDIEAEADAQRNIAQALGF
jgi:uncharacterized phage-associated protein